MSGLAAGAGTLHWQGGSQEAAYRLAVERAAMEGPAPSVAPPAPLPGEQRPEVVVMADTDVSVGIEVCPARESRALSPPATAEPDSTLLAGVATLYRRQGCYIPGCANWS